MTSFLLIGYGNMGKALSSRWAGGYAIVDTKKPKGLPKEISYFSDVGAVKETPQAVLLAVKPQQLPEVLSACAKHFGTKPVYISIAAGVTLATLQKALGKNARVIRAMPNTPAKVGEAVTVLIGNAATKLKEREFTDNLFAASGTTLWLDDESLMNAVTAVSGSGPAYQFYVMECLIDAAVKLGLSRVQAETLVLATCKGACSLAEQSEEDLATLRQNVTSKGGTTEAALNVLMDGSVAKTFDKALKAAKTRAEKL
jgi:pyrroline-5-carboxylate reductase